MNRAFRLIARLTVISLVGALSLHSYAIPKKTVAHNDESSVSAPDFAYPKKVITDADTGIKRGLKQKDYPLVINSLMNKCAAMLAINADSISACNSILADTESSIDDTGARALIDLLQASFIKEYYLQNTWKISQQPVPLNESSRDMRQWSKQQFEDTLLRLADKVYNARYILIDIPVDKYKSSINTNAMTPIYFPTLWDFAVYRIIDIIAIWNNSNRTFPASLIESHVSPALLDMLRISGSMKISLKMLDALIEMSPDRAAPLAHANVTRIKLLSGYDQSISDTALWDKYKQTCDTEFSGEYLAGITMPSAEIQSDTDVPPVPGLIEYIKAVKNNISRFPGYPRIDNLKNIISIAEEKSLSVKFLNSVSPGTPFCIDVSSRNIKSGKILIYKAPDTDDYIKLSRLGSPLYTFPFETITSSPVKTTTSVKCMIPVAGRYIVAASSDGLTSTVCQSKLYVTDLGLFTSRADKTWATVVNPTDGTPLSGISIRTVKDKQLGVTDKDGIFNYTLTKPSAIFATNGSDRTPDISIYAPSKPQRYDIVTGRMTTSLAVYHPGDTINWAAYVYRESSGSYRVENKRAICIELLDVNGRKINADTLKTDDWGRADGKFAIPKDGLTGYFNLNLLPQLSDDESADDIRTRNSYLPVMVSDYKLPTFMIDSLHCRRNTPGDGDVTITGRVITYTGFPVSQANIELTVNKSSYWWRGNDNEFITSIDTISGSDGQFKAVISGKLLQLYENRNGYFSVKVDATSPAGETQTGETSFTTGYKYHIFTDTDGIVEGNLPYTMKMRVLDNEDKPIPSLIDYRLLKGDTVIDENQTNVPNPTFNWADIPSGQYTLELSLPDTTLAATVKQKIIIYRTNDKVSPVDDILWIPRRTVSFKKGEPVTIGYEAKRDSLHFIVTAISNGYSMTRHQIVTHAGYNTLELSPADSVKQLVIYFDGIIDHRFINENITVNIEHTDPSLKIITESFRDRLIPGVPETWLFKVVNENGHGTESAMLIDMYNKSLDKIINYNPLSLPHRRPYGNLSLQSNGSTKMGYLNIWGDNKRNNTIDVQLTPPTFRHTSPVNRHYMRGRVYAYANDYATAATEHAMPMSMKSAAGATADIAIGSDSETITEESAVENADIGTTTDAGSSVVTEDTSSNDSFAYRDSEIASGLFKPMLTTDRDGNIAISFTVPNANTTWRLNCMAYTRELLSTTFNTDIVTSKEVMVQPNLPRFVRAGDQITIQSTIMNNASDTRVINTVVETFDPISGNIIMSSTFENTVDPQNSCIVESTLEIPMDKSMIGFRIKSTTGQYTDGEQAMIPILPSTQPVIDSSTFYLAPDSTSYSTSIPATSGGDRVTLTFCENPGWSVVTALPGLTNYQPSTALGASYAIFSAAVAEGLMKDNPTIRRELHRWLDGDRTDSTLVSMLSRNQELKTFMLNATPWVSAAENDTERMTRLALLFDRKAIDDTYSTNITTLEKLALNGGFRWCSFSDEPSLWQTINVLTNIGRLKQLGYLPDNKRLSHLIDSAVKYVDREIATQFRKHPDADYSEYAFMRRYFKDIKMSTAASAANAAAVQSALTDWKHAGLYTKAYLGHILLSNGYHSTVKTILESISQYSLYTPDKGMWWPSMNEGYNKLSCSSLILTLYNEAAPGCSEIDRIRQWLIGEKEVQNWGTSAATTDVIAAILSSSKSYLGQAGNIRIAVNGNELQLPRFDSAVGRYNIDLSQQAPSGGTMTIVRTGNSPSWGSVMSFHNSKMTDIEATQTDGLSIEKKLYLIENTPLGPSATETTEFKTGDLVRVELIITTDRSLDYVAIDDERAACLEPVNQLPAPQWQSGACFYRENRDAVTNIFVTHLARGVYRLSYEMRVNNRGEFAAGIATIQSQYAPGLTAHSAGARIYVR